MKRGGPLRRKTPLARGTKPMERGQEPKRRPRKRRRPPMGQDTRHGVYQRAGGRCDRCAAPLPTTGWECHHRKLRSRGGTDEPENLLALCSTCHHAHVHGKPRQATEAGYMVPSWADPASTPVLRHGRAWQLPTGRAWVPAEPPTEGAA